ncbi:MAG TPA: 1-deoxy-D-xylulose-5-phosphate reductoisomerase [Actinobacteria bacterium]|nr:1-deoxy-D-xylulose-5-phosphate reductoisomerase [Actinomycetota bacterium]
MRPVAVLGATGSIGRQTLEVIAEMEAEVAAIAARRGSRELWDLATAHPQARIGVAAPTPTERDQFGGLGSRVVFGDEAVASLAGEPGIIVVNAVVGVAGLKASLVAAEAGNRLALANKESMVAGGPVVGAALAAGGGELIPVDSEHSALFQLLAERKPGEVRRLVLTASGGPFRGMTADQVADVTPEQALRHPTWQMGPRITIDSATLMNKALEVIEAHHLFGFPYDAIEVVVHPQSLVHGVVELSDGALLAHFCDPDMRIPIRYALTHPERGTRRAPHFPLAATSLTFEPPDLETFPALRLGYEAGRAGGSAPAVLNAADEIAVQAFLTGRIGFASIAVVVERTLNDVPVGPVESVGQVLEADLEARLVATGHLGNSC